MQSLTDKIMSLSSQKLKELCDAGQYSLESSKIGDRRQALISALSSGDEIKRKYLALSRAQRMIVDADVMANGHLRSIVVSSICEEFGLFSRKSGMPGSFAPYLPYGSQANLFFLFEDHIPDFHLEYLTCLVLNRVAFDGWQPPPGSAIICRSGRVSDFATLSLYSATNSIASTSSGMPTKVALAKMQANVGWEDVAGTDDGSLCTIKEAKKPADIKIGPALHFVAENADLLAKDRMHAEILSSTEDKLGAFILDSYLKSNNVHETRFRTDMRAPDNQVWTSPRKYVAGILKELPVDAWVDFAYFNLRARLKDVEFLSPVGHLSKRSSYRIGYTWNTAQRSFLEIMLRCFCAIGVVDLAFNTNPTPFGATKQTFEIVGLRLNAFGAHLLGNSSSYVPKEERQAESGIIVNPDFCILVQGKKAILESSPFLSTYFTAVRGSDETMSFKLEISGLFKALDKGTSGKELMDRLSKLCSLPIPDNVMRTWEGWIEKSKKIRIRKLTMLDITADDPEIRKSKLAQLGNLAKSSGLAFSPLDGHAAIINESDIKKVKRILEKDGKYVSLKT
ncbi:MAG: hypothetical protein LBT59_26240 [Clostridiales bacterium]|jgi:hypothetical protein|nr:hypothetical protein [Clostridiales bacterium]